MGDPKQTNIPDPEGATHGLNAMAARATVLGEQIGRIGGRIAALEAARPWGSAPEYGGQFEARYHSGQGGSEQVRKEAAALSGNTLEGANTAHDALTHSVELDHEGANIFKLQAGDAPTSGGRTAPGAPRAQ